MARWYHAVLLAVLVCLLLVADLAQASVGGPSSVELLGWDPVARKVFVAVHYEDDSLQDRPQLGYYLLDAEDPERWIPDMDFQEATLGQGGPDPLHDRIDALRDRLEPMVPVDPIGLELRERLLAVEGCLGLAESAVLAPCRDVLVQLHWQGQIRELRLTTWGQSDVVGAWEVPETGHRVVLYTHLGHTWEIGYQQELAVLFEPASPAPIRELELGPRDKGREEEVAWQQATSIRHD